VRSSARHLTGIAVAKVARWRRSSSKKLHESAQHGLCARGPCIDEAYYLAHGRGDQCSDLVFRDALATLGLTPTLYRGGPMSASRSTYETWHEAPMLVPQVGKGYIWPEPAPSALGFQLIQKKTTIHPVRGSPRNPE
jgi:hypothetical protein